MFGLPRRQNSHRAHGNPGSTATRSPMFRLGVVVAVVVVVGPIWVMTPADSWPRTRGREREALVQLWRSEPQMPVLTSRTCTSPGPGSRTGRGWMASWRAPAGRGEEMGRLVDGYVGRRHHEL